MLATALLLSLLSATPAERFALDHPGSERILAAGGSRLLHASGLSVAPRGKGPAESARAFLAAEGAAFGLAAGHELVLRSAPAAGRAGAVRFERRIQGLPVFGGHLAVGVDASARIRAVNAGDVPGAPTGRHAIGERAAVAAALASFPGGARGAGPARVTAGWRRLLGQLRAAYRVDFIATEPAGDWRVFVDGATSAPLFREDLRFRATAPASVYEVSPAETAASACPLSGTGGRSFCASPVTVTLQNLIAAPPTTLTGSQSTVYNCRGENAPTSPALVPGLCAAVSSAGGGFSFAADASFTALDDDFSAAMAYHHLDRHASFLKGLDPTLPGGTARALNGSLPALVNAQQGGLPLDNAFFSGGLDAMVFGQGTSADFAYDASIIYHEFTHGVVSAWGGFALDIDGMGGLDEPGAVNEGTADALSAALVGRSQVAAFPAAFESPPVPFFRDMSDPDASRTCKGNGTVVSQFGTTAINGLDGEVHDDGEIWNGFFWEVHQGLEGAGIRGCSGGCPAGAAIQYQALQLAGDSSPTLGTYWQTFKAAATLLFPARPEVATYVDCVARRRGMDRCDRTVPVYQGETKLQFVRLRYSPFQMVIQVASTSAALSLCSANGTATTVHARRGAPVGLQNIDAGGNATFIEDGRVSLTQLCSSGNDSITLTGAGAWYLLFDSPGAFPGASPGFDIYKVVVDSGGATRPPALAPPTCTVGGPAALAIQQAPASVASGSSLTLVATGGSGSGYTWSFVNNLSGGTLGATTGLYTAGPTAGVVDVVRVQDSLGAQAIGTVSVTAPPSPPSGGSGGGGGCSGGGGGILAAALGLLALLGARPARRKR